MSQPVASATSAPSPIEGNNHNSSLNFQFLELPASGSLTIQVTDNPDSSTLDFTLWHVKGGLPDQKVKSGLTNGSTVAVSDVELGANYYIGDPHGTSQNFVVVFMAG